MGEVPEDCGLADVVPLFKKSSTEKPLNHRLVSLTSILEMPHFLDWFVPVYLMISILILVGFGACIYYFEPGLQEAHKWRTQRPITEREVRKTLMIRDNLGFRAPEV
ncbi:small integral membrane protein 45 isoform X2 [Stegostoma tigrinum]|nr:small integral membrane protein 45 isoform X2 [Stegostoma tigrinum]